MPRNWHPEDVKAAVRKTGISLSELARRNRVSPSTVHKALTEPHPTGNRAVAAYLGRSVHELWPDWYDRDGNRTRSTGQKNSSRPRAGHRQNARAA
ncbi:MAG: transcriptional regulator [Alphaproteobacteria bacterium]